MKQMLFSLIALVALSCGDPAVEKYDPVPGGGGGGTVPVTPTPQPAEDHWAALADSCTNVLVTNFLDKSTGTFWSTPNDIEHSTTYIYWQQAHALDVLLNCAERVKESDPNRAALYLEYADKWYRNYANNYNRTYRGEGEYGGFFNDYTDDMKTGWSNRQVPLFKPLKQALKGKEGHLITSAHGELVTIRAWKVVWASYKHCMETAINGMERRWYGRTKEHKKTGHPPGSRSVRVAEPTEVNCQESLRHMKGSA